MDRAGKLEVIFGVMYAGKSTELVNRFRRYCCGLGEPAQMFKPAIDTRYGQQKVSTHDGLQVEAYFVNDTRELEKNLKQDTKIIGIDEIQFLDDAIIDFCDEAANNDKIVLVAGLAKDFRDLPFCFQNSQRTIYDLLPYADEVTHKTAICMHVSNGVKCSRDATKIQRFIDGKIAPFDSPVVQIGGKEAYKVFCRAHYAPYQKSL